jgi:hypothetical protein
MKETLVLSGYLMLDKKKETAADTFSQWLDAQLEKRGWSLRHMARLMDTSAGWITNVKSGKANRTRSAVNRLCDALEVTEADRESALLAAGFAPRDIPLTDEALMIGRLYQKMPKTRQRIFERLLREFESFSESSATADVADPEADD